MPRIVLVTGGARSGKSTYAEKLCLKLSQNTKKPVYIATAVAFDDEMKDRIQKHRQRRGDSFTTVEESLDLAKAVSEHDDSPVLVDCLTVWTGNLMYYSKDNSQYAIKAAELLINALKQRSNDIVLVTNETGSGIVPDNEEARKFRDLAGIINQKVASVATDVVLTVCSIPLAVKGELI